jgi:two-component system phosphate regulon sensor histidine kinase PhoR
MVFRSRGLALFLALCVAIITTLFLSLFESIGYPILIVAFGITFSSAYLLVFVVLEFLIFREINKIHKLVEKLKRMEFSKLDKQRSTSLTQFKTINEEIFSFAELKQQEIDELKKLETFRREFIANVSHELKTPIFAAQGFVHTLLDGAVEDKNVRIRFLKKAAKSLDGLDVLVQDLLTLSHIETGQIKMHFDRFDLLNLTREVLEQLEVNVNEKQITINILGNHKKVMVYADEQRISQVLTNLITNAINYSPEGSKVLIRFEVLKRNVQTTIQDFGEGIPAEHVPRIFERFYRVDKSRSREHGGTGLGLAIVKHILDGHHSKVDVVSVPDQGSSFSFKLPRNKPESA